jgi:hypothetical protein
MPLSVSYPALYGLEQHPAVPVGRWLNASQSERRSPARCQSPQSCRFPDSERESALHRLEQGTAGRIGTLCGLLEGRALGPCPSRQEARRIERFA